MVAPQVESCRPFRLRARQRTDREHFCEEFRDPYRDSGRDLVLWFGRKRCGLTLRALAQRVGGLDYTSVGLAVKRFEQRLLVNKKLRHLTDQVDKALRL